MLVLGSYTSTVVSGFHASHPPTTQIQPWKLATAACERPDDAVRAIKSERPLFRIEVITDYIPTLREAILSQRLSSLAKR